MPQSISTSQNAQYSELTAIATSQRRRSGKGCLRRGAARRGAAGATAVLSVGRGRALFQPPRFTTPACFPPQAGLLVPCMAHTYSGYPCT
jgi:hypothetical protein